MSSGPRRACTTSGSARASRRLPSCARCATARTNAVKEPSMRYVDPPRSAFGAPPQGGAAGGPAKPDPRRPLDGARAGAALLICVVLMGCASLNEPLKAISDTVAAPFKKDEAKEEPKAATAAPAASAAVAAAPTPVSETPVPPAAQRAFDEAVRQLAAGRTAEAERGFKALVQSN